MNSVLEYKGYHAKVEFDAENSLLYGKIEGITDLVTFESDNLNNIRTEFENAVDDYLEFCEVVGKNPDKEYKGTFNVRISPELHKRLAIAACKNGESLNATVEKAIQTYLSENTKTYTELQNTVRILSRALETQTVYREGELTISQQSNIIPFNNTNHVKISYQS